MTPDNVDPGAQDCPSMDEQPFESASADAVPDAGVPNRDPSDQQGFPREAQRLDPRSITAERISSWITTAVITLGLLASLLVAAMLLDWSLLLVGVLLMIWLALFGLLAWVSHVLPVWSYQHTWYFVNEERIEIYRGIFWKHIISVPRSRVQHTDVSQGPLMRRFEIAKLILHTAGTENASVELEGLAHSTALTIRDLLIHEGRPHVAN